MSINNSISAYISLGSNLGNCIKNLNEAIECIDTNNNLKAIDISPIYITEPQGLKEQTWFYNQVIRINCNILKPRELMQFLLDTEKKLGRIRHNDINLRYGERTIDLDLLLFGQEYSQDSFCTIPHMHMFERAFVLIPLRHVLCEDTIIKQKDIDIALSKLNYNVQDNKIYQP